MSQNKATDFLAQTAEYWLSKGVFTVPLRSRSKRPKGKDCLLRSQLIMSQLDVDMELDPALPMLPCDPVQLQQVFLNILKNAIDATAKQDPPDRQVLIRIRHLKSNAVEISFEDSGIGFKNELSNLSICKSGAQRGLRRAGSITV